MLKHRLILGSLLASIAGVSSAADNLVSNGGFELPGFASDPIPKYMLDGDNTTIAGWTVSDPTLGLGSTQPAVLVRSDGYPAVLAGTYSLVLTEQSAIQTTFAAIAGKNYRLTFLADVQNAVTGLNVTAAGQSTSFVIATGLQTFQFTAAATDPAAMLEFKNVSPDDGTFRQYWLDSVAVTPVPEPAAAYSMGAGLLALLVFARLRARARVASRARFA